ncbi:MAG: sensor histidine kinase, partial [Pseudomonadota bacterium]
RLTTRTTGPDAFAETFGQRLASLAANQDLLVNSGWSTIDLRSLVEAQTAPFADGEGGRIEIDGAAMDVSAEVSQAIGMAIHELATNALKYGALSRGGGRVKIDWNVSDGRDAVFKLSWQESGGPKVDAPGRNGFGTTVITSMAAKAVGGNVDLDYAPAGLRWTLTAPLARVK